MKKCNKVPFSKIEAEIALKRALKLGKFIKRRKEKRIYHCSICNHWHLTSTEEGEIKTPKTIYLTQFDKWLELIKH